MLTQNDYNTLKGLGALKPPTLLFFNNKIFMEYMGRILIMEYNQDSNNVKMVSKHHQNTKLKK